MQSDLFKKQDRKKWIKQSFSSGCASEKMSEWLLQEQGFSLPWKEKDTRSSLKVADENLEENLIWIKAVTRLQTQNHWVLPQSVFSNDFCTSSLSSFRSHHSVFEALRQCRHRSREMTREYTAWSRLGDRFCQQNKPTQQSRYHSAWVWESGAAPSDQAAYYLPVGTSITAFHLSPKNCESRLMLSWHGVETFCILFCHLLQNKLLE